jgi:hypothetical protein
VVRSFASTRRNALRAVRERAAPAVSNRAAAKGLGTAHDAIGLTAGPHALRLRLALVRRADAALGIFVR